MTHPLQIRSTVLTAAKAHKCYNIFTPTSHLCVVCASYYPYSRAESTYNLQQCQTINFHQIIVRMLMIDKRAGCLQPCLLAYWETSEK